MANPVLLAPGIAYFDILQTDVRAIVQHLGAIVVGWRSVQTRRNHIGAIAGFAPPAALVIDGVQLAAERGEC